MDKVKEIERDQKRWIEIGDGWRIVEGKKEEKDL